MIDHAQRKLRVIDWGLGEVRCWLEGVWLCWVKCR